MEYALKSCAGMEKSMSVDVIVPVYKPDSKLECLLKMLVTQTVKPDNIFLLNTEMEPGYLTKDVEVRVKKAIQGMVIEGSGQVNIRILPIKKEEFDHGATRHYGATLSSSDYLLFMTHDAVPKDNNLIEKLLEPFYDPNVSAAYARQIAYPEADLVETYTRIFNYPKNSYTKSKEDLNRLGIKTYFCSNVCAIYKREQYEELEGFVRKTIFNEDMIFAAKLINAGYKVAYASDAVVYHSHNYNAKEQFHRNFDLGVSHREYKQLFEGVSSESEGIKLVKDTISFLWDQKEYVEMIKFLVQCGAKYTGYFMGKNYTILPENMILWCSMNKGYWRK